MPERGAQEGAGRTLHQARVPGQPVHWRRQDSQWRTGSRLPAPGSGTRGPAPLTVANPNQDRRLRHTTGKHHSWVERVQRVCAPRSHCFSPPWGSNDPTLQMEKRRLAEVIPCPRAHSEEKKGQYPEPSRIYSKVNWRSELGPRF